MARPPDPPALTGTVALVTGATAGIGRATAARLAALGATVWAVGRDGARTRATAFNLAFLGAILPPLLGMRPEVRRPPS